MKVIKGRLTEAEKQAIKAILTAGPTEGKVRGKNYYISLTEGVYTVKIVKQDRGLIPCPGSPLRTSTYTHQFTI